MKVEIIRELRRTVPHQVYPSDVIYHTLLNMSSPFYWHYHLILGSMVGLIIAAWLTGFLCQLATIEHWIHANHLRIQCIFHIMNETWQLTTYFTSFHLMQGVLRDTMGNIGILGGCLTSLRLSNLWGEKYQFSVFCINS